VRYSEISIEVETGSKWRLVLMLGAHLIAVDVNKKPAPHRRREALGRDGEAEGEVVTGEPKSPCPLGRNAPRGGDERGRGWGRGYRGRHWGWGWIEGGEEPRRRGRDGLEVFRDGFLLRRE